MKPGQDRYGVSLALATSLSSGIEGTTPRMQIFPEIRLVVHFKPRGGQGAVDMTG